MRLFLAIIMPWLQFFTIGRPIAGLDGFCYDDGLRGRHSSTRFASAQLLLPAALVATSLTRISTEKRSFDRSASKFGVTAPVLGA